MAELPDEFMEKVRAYWGELGMSPVMLFRLMERGYLHCEIKQAFDVLIGVGWEDLNVTAWIDRIEHQIPDAFGDGSDKYPVIDCLEKLLISFLSNNPAKNLCPYCQLEVDLRGKVDPLLKSRDN